MEISLLDIGITLVGLALANWSIKLGRAAPLIKKAYELAKEEVEARKDKELTQKEKAKLYDNIIGLLNEAYSFIKGWFPNKSKK